MRIWIRHASGEVIDGGFAYPGNLSGPANLCDTEVVGKMIKLFSRAPHYRDTEARSFFHGCPLAVTGGAITLENAPKN